MKRQGGAETMSGARRAHSESTDVAIACICIMIAVPAVMMIGVLVMWILDGWRAGLGQ